MPVSLSRNLLTCCLDTTPTIVAPLLCAFADNPSCPRITPVNSLPLIPVYSIYSATAVSSVEAQSIHKMPPSVGSPDTEVKIIPVV